MKAKPPAKARHWEERGVEEGRGRGRQGESEGAGGVSAELWRLRGGWWWRAGRAVRELRVC